MLYYVGELIIVLLIVYSPDCITGNKCNLLRSEQRI